MTNFSSRSIESRKAANNRGNFRENNSRNSRNYGEKPKSPLAKFLPIIVFLFLVILLPIYSSKSLGETIIEPRTFTVNSGDSISTLNESLNLGLSGWRYKLYVKFFAPDNIAIKAGNYETTEAMTLENFLKNGMKKTATISNEQTIKLLPGWNIWDYDAYFVEKGILNAGDFEKAATENFSKYQAEYKFLAGAKSLEGFLMPDTYRIFKNSSADNIIKRLLDNFEAKIANDYNSLDAKKAYETLIMASIVEREEKNPTNRPIVAGILGKRVKEGIAMGADATVCYGFKKTFKECTPAFIGSVITDHSNIYNTRKSLGYPPTPISSVSASAWNAAFKPEKSQYYYYLHDNNGAIHYATTLAEHNANVQKYLR